MADRAAISLLLLLATAVPAQQQWAFLDGPHYAARGVAFDSRRGRLVAFGYEAETWEMDGLLRLHRPTSAGPFGRSSQAMVYDSARGEVMLLGGRTVPALGDIWLWNGATWRQPFFAVAPPRRFSAGIAFDSWRNRVVLFGGQDAGVLADTWEYDGSQWTQMLPATVPGSPNAPLMTFDSARGVTVMLISTGMVGTPLETWEWAGVDWTRRLPTGPRLATGRSLGLTYDSVRQRSVLFGCNGGPNELWEWDGSAWLLRGNPATSVLTQAGVWFDTVRGVTVITEGYDAGWRSAAWSWDGSTFAPLWPQPFPPVRSGHALILDTTRNLAVMFGGTYSVPGNPLPLLRLDTWEWDGSAWLQRTPATTPPGRSNAAGCFDPVSASCLLFGGSSLAGNLADFWRWDGSNWSQLAAGPPTRVEGAMAWDAARSEAILFGGSVYNQGQHTWLGDTWRWNGTSWTQVATPAAPTARSRHTLVFDPQRGRMVSWGGIASGFTLANQLTDTWEWDGTQWQAIAVTQSPPVLGSVCMVHDPVRQRMVLAGNELVGQNGNLAVFDYDGATWTRTLTTQFGFFGAPKMLWDPVRQQPLLFEAFARRELTSGPATADHLGNGCGAPPPLLAARTCPRTGEAAFGLEVLGRPAMPVVFALGFGAGSTPLGHGCTLLVQQIGASMFTVAGGNGVAIQPIPLPGNHALRGLVVHAQALALDPAAAGGLAMTQALRLTVGD